MTPERWQRIKQVYQSTLELDVNRRKAFLEEACAGDESLLKEVESLLAEEVDSGNLLESPALDVAARELAENKAQEPQPDLTGRTLLHYRINEKIGEGGMGVVYKARDTHLDRSVAIKVLPRKAVADPERKRRFVQEAKAASALNHPNIIQIHDINSDGGVNFIVMEHVAGKTLDRRIGRKGLPLGEALKYGIQIADALAAAQAAGIVHRDLKPANVMVTDKGVVKVLDFGLAKLTQPLRSDELGSESALKSLTDEGRIMGTVAYMSPEQAEGKPVDARSDIFSFGSVLYEMLSGRRAFQGDSSVSTLSAILTKDATPLGGAIPQELEKIITRCLRKDPARRFQHMDDIKIALEELKEESDSGRLAGIPVSESTKRRTWKLWVPIAATLILAGAGILYYLRSTSKPYPPSSVIPLTSLPGSQEFPSLSPDGKQVAFQWDGEKQDNVDIYVQMVSGGKPLRLTTDPAPDLFPSWSPDASRIAFLRREFVYLISPLGGVERKLAQVGGGIFSWSPDGKWISAWYPFAQAKPAGICLISVETGEMRKLTFPPAIQIANGGDFDGVFSPDGRIFAFDRVLAFGHDIYILPLDHGQPIGRPWRLTVQNRNILGLAWTPDGKEIVFSSNLGGRRSLWRIAASAGAIPQRISGTDDASWPSISGGSSPRLAYQRTPIKNTIWRMTIPPDGSPGSPPVSLTAASCCEIDPQISPDGRKIVFSSQRGGTPELYVCDSDGSNAFRLTSFNGVRHAGAPRWSPDGRLIAFDSSSWTSFDIMLMGVEGGTPRQLNTGTSPNVRPSWSRDGRWIYFGSTQSGSWQIYKSPVEGGAARQITQGGGWEAFEAPDRKTLYYTKGRPGPPGLWKAPVDGGEEVALNVPAWSGSWTMIDKGIYYLDFPADSSVWGPRSEPVPLKLFSFDTGNVRQVGLISKLRLVAAAALSATRDGRWIVWTQPEQHGSDLQLIDNFR